MIDHFEARKPPLKAMIVQRTAKTVCETLGNTAIPSLLQHQSTTGGSGHVSIGDT
jgi:hypothetical protein